MARGLRFTSGLALLLAATAAGAADDGPIVTERPSVSASPLALPEGRWQLETGAQYTNGAGRVDTQTAPFALLRRSLGDRVELQVGWTGVTRLEARGEDETLREDGSFALKWQLTPDGARTALALLGSTTLPLGEEPAGGDGTDPALGLLWTHAAGGAELFGTALATDRDAGTELTNAVGVGFPVGRATSAYVEYAGTWLDDRGSHLVNAGIAWLPHDDLQLDVYGGLGLDGDADDTFLGLGLSRRF
jgi:hypothetical protein